MRYNKLYSRYDLEISSQVKVLYNIATAVKIHWSGLLNVSSKLKRSEKTGNLCQKLFVIRSGCIHLRNYTLTQIWWVVLFECCRGKGRRGVIFIENLAKRMSLSLSQWRSFIANRTCVALTFLGIDFALMQRIHKKDANAPGSKWNNENPFCMSLLCFLSPHLFSGYPALWRVTFISEFITIVHTLLF